MSNGSRCRSRESETHREPANPKQISLSTPHTHPLSNTALPLRPDQTPTRRHFRLSFGRPTRDRWPVVSGPVIEAAFCWQLSSSCFMSRFHSPVRSSLRLWLLFWMPVWPGAPGIRDVCLARRKFWLGRGPTWALNQPTPKFSLEPPHRGCRRRSVAAWGRHWVCGGNSRLPRRLEPGVEPSFSRHAQGLYRRMMWMNATRCRMAADEQYNTVPFHKLCIITFKSTPGCSPGARRLDRSPLCER